MIMTTPTFRKRAVSAALIVGMGLSTFSLPAIAAYRNVTLGTDQTKSRTVRYGDLDLDKTEDAKELYKRISRAAWAVCREQRDIHSLYMNEFYKQCVQTAIDNAVRDVGDHNLAVVHGELGPAVASR
jgi:UrcA family protein